MVTLVYNLSVKHNNVCFWTQSNQFKSYHNWGAFLSFHTKCYVIFLVMEISFYYAMLN